MKCSEFKQKDVNLKLVVFSFWQTNQKEKSDIPLDPNLNAPGKHNNKPKTKTKQSIPVFTCQTVELQALTAK